MSEMLSVCGCWLAFCYDKEGIFFTSLFFLLWFGSLSVSVVCHFYYVHIPLSLTPSLSLSLSLSLLSLSPSLPPSFPPSLPLSLPPVFSSHLHLFISIPHLPSTASWFPLMSSSPSKKVGLEANDSKLNGWLIPLPRQGTKAFLLLPNYSSSYRATLHFFSPNFVNSLEYPLSKHCMGPNSLT